LLPRCFFSDVELSPSSTTISRVRGLPRLGSSFFLLLSTTPRIQPPSDGAAPPRGPWSVPIRSTRCSSSADVSRAYPHRTLSSVSSSLTPVGVPRRPNWRFFSCAFGSVILNFQSSFRRPLSTSSFPLLASQPRHTRAGFLVLPAVRSPFSDELSLVFCACSSPRLCDDGFLSLAQILLRRFGSSRPPSLSPLDLGPFDFSFSHRLIWPSR